MAIDLRGTIRGSMIEGFFPKGWDLEAIDAACAAPAEAVTNRESWWHGDFVPTPCATLADFDTMLGHAIAWEIAQTARDDRPLAMILPVGPMGMYRWTVYFLQSWGVSCKHVHGFNMDEWSDAEGNTLAPDDPGAFQNAMEDAFYGPLGDGTVPVEQRHFATRDELPAYAERIAAIKKDGGRLVTVFGIGRACHIAFWEPHFADEYASVDEWKAADHRLAAQLHPMTVEQNAITSFKSRTTLVSARANTVGPGLFLQSDGILGGADGMLGRGMMWQGMSLRMTLHLEPTPWIPSTFMPTLPGRLFFLQELAGPLEPECN
jgi:glucosamine-6-phosphate deaminase